jgi:hypothetical protein
MGHAFCARGMQQESRSSLLRSNQEVTTDAPPVAAIAVVGS